MRVFTGLESIVRESIVRDISMRWILLSGLVCFSGVSAGAQVDAYRPGVPYAAVAAQAPEQCVAACAGDAACGAWNFKRARGGAVCEFLERDVAAVASPGAVSGAAPNMAPNIKKVSARLVRRAPGLAVRVGQPAVMKTPMERQKVVRRDVVRPIVTKPRFRHVLEGAPLSARMVPQMLPRVAPRWDSVAPQTMARVGATPATAAAAAAEPVAEATVIEAATLEAPAISPFAVAPSATVPAAPVPRVPATQESLFGSLYDDVAVPAALPDAPAADAPIATAVSVPVSEPVMKGLAGG